MFPTKTKTDAKLVTKELRKIRNTVDLPIVVIGDINSENAACFRSVKVDGLAVISSVIAQPDFRKAAAELKVSFCGQKNTNRRYGISF